jgi:hypothetical protein
MRWTVRALIALFGLAAIPSGAGGAQPGHFAMLKVSVRPGTGSPRTAFAVSFQPAASTGAVVPARHVYRVTASTTTRGRCQSGAAAQAAPARAGSRIRVVLSPARATGWCTGTFRGHVWDSTVTPCPHGFACPAIVPLPRLVGSFAFRVTRG